MIRILILALLIYFGYRLVKSLGGRPLQTRDGNAPGAERPGGTELIQDPQCGTYFLKHQGVESQWQGQTLHFCSSQCRDAYLEAHR